MIDILRFHQVWGEVLSGCIRTLAGSRRELLDGIHLDIISLVKEIYSVLGRVSEVPRKVFASLPNMDLAELKNLEELLQTEMSDRKYRQAFKAFMIKYVVGMNLLSTIDPRSVIRNLPEALGNIISQPPLALALLLILPCAGARSLSLSLYANSDQE